ncbi:hypothetical protein ABPG72_004274 [Tetrahymena utriculariae]
MIDNKNDTILSYEVFYQGQVLIQRCNKPFYQDLLVCIVLKQDIIQLQQTQKDIKINNFTTFNVKVNCVKDCVFTFFAYFGNLNRDQFDKYQLLSLQKSSVNYPRSLNFNKKSISFDVISNQNTFDLKDLIIKNNLIIIKQRPKESGYFFFVNKLDRNKFIINQDKMIKIQDFILIMNHQQKLFEFCFFTLGNVTVQFDKKDIILKQATYTKFFSSKINVDSLRIISDENNESYVTTLDENYLGFDVEEYYFFDQQLFQSIVQLRSLFFFEQICIEPIFEDVSITIFVQNRLINYQKEIANLEKQFSYCHKVQSSEENITQLMLKSLSNSKTVVKINKCKYLVQLDFDRSRFQVFYSMQDISKFIIIDQIDSYFQIVFTVIHISSKQNITDKSLAKQTKTFQMLKQQIVTVSQIKHQGDQIIIRTNFDENLFFQENNYLSMQLFYKLNDFKIIYFWFSKKKNKFLSTFQNEETPYNVEIVIEPYKLNAEFVLMLSDSFIPISQIIGDEFNYKQQQLPFISSFSLEKSQLRLEDDGKIHLKYQLYCSNQCLNPQISQKNSQNNILKIQSNQFISESINILDFEFQEYSSLYLFGPYKSNTYFYQEHNLFIFEFQTAKTLTSEQYLACEDCLQRNLSNQQIFIISNQNKIALQLGLADIVKQNQQYFEDHTKQSFKLLYLKNNDQLFLTLLYTLNIFELNNYQNLKNYQLDYNDYQKKDIQSRYVFYKNKNKQNLVVYCYDSFQVQSLLFTAQTYTIPIEEIQKSMIFEIENRYERYVFFIQYVKNQFIQEYIFQLDIEQEKSKNTFYNIYYLLQKQFADDISVNDNKSIYFNSNQITIQYFQKFENLYDHYKTESETQVKKIKFILKSYKLITLNIDENVFNEQYWPSSQLLFTFKLEKNLDYRIQLSDEFIQENKNKIGIAFYSANLMTQDQFINSYNFLSKEESFAVQSQTFEVKDLQKKNEYLVLLFYEIPKNFKIRVNKLSKYQIINKLDQQFKFYNYTFLVFDKSFEFKNLYFESQAKFLILEASCSQNLIQMVNNQYTKQIIQQYSYYWQHQMVFPYLAHVSQSSNITSDYLIQEKKFCAVIVSLLQNQEQLISVKLDSNQQFLIEPIFEQNIHILHLYPKKILSLFKQDDSYQLNLIFIDSKNLDIFIKYVDEDEGAKQIIKQNCIYAQIDIPQRVKFVQLQKQVQNQKNDETFDLIYLSKLKLDKVIHLNQIVNIRFMQDKQIFQIFLLIYDKIKLTYELELINQISNQSNEIIFQQSGLVIYSNDNLNTKIDVQIRISNRFKIIILIFNTNSTDISNLIQVKSKNEIQSYFDKYIFEQNQILYKYLSNPSRINIQFDSVLNNYFLQEVPKKVTYEVCLTKKQIEITNQNFKNHYKPIEGAQNILCHFIIERPSQVKRQQRFINVNPFQLTQNLKEEDYSIKIQAIIQKDILINLDFPAIGLNVQAIKQNYFTNLILFIILLINSTIIIIFICKKERLISQNKLD